MKAVVEPKNSLYLIRIYGSDGLLCDAYAVEQLEVKTDKGGIIMPAKSQDIELALWIVN